MLTEFFYKILMLSLSGTILFFLILILKPLTKRVFSPYLNYCLVIIALLTFIIPYSALIPKIQNSFIDIPNIIEGKNIIEVNKGNEILNVDTTHINDKSEKTQKPKPVKDNTVTKIPVIKGKAIIDFSYVKSNLAFIWLLGTIIFFSNQFIGVISFNKKLRSSSRSVQRQDIKALFYECEKLLEINKEIPLMVCESIGTPMVTGLLNSVITIPTEEFDLNMLKMIFIHELNHYKRKDLWIKVMSFGALAVHWFNPVIYLVNKEINKYCELSCDFQVVKDMNNDDKKYYGLVILKAMDNSFNRKITLSTAMAGSSKNQLKERLGMIKSSKRPKKLMVLLSVITAVMLTVTGVFVSSALAQTKENKNVNDFAVMVKDKSLWAVNLSKSSKEVIIDKEGVFKDPSISPNGENVAYTKGQSLYVAPIDLKQGQKKVIKIADNIVSYAWANNNDLAYSTEKGGLNGFSLNSKKTCIYIKSEERYEYMTSDKNGTIYGEVYRYYTKDGSEYIEAKGVVSYKLKLGKKRLIVEPKPAIKDGTTLASLGLTPRVAGVSKDGAYVYIWCRVHSGSTNSDGVPFGVYDVKNNKFIRYDDKQIFALAYKDNLAINPINGKMPVLNNGGVRNMNINKTIGTVDVTKGEFKSILPQNMISTTNDPYNLTTKGMVTMTPSFSPDGKKIIYSASNVNEDVEKWMEAAHNIYTVDVNTKKVEKITKGNSFDFAPKYILKGKGIIFVRKTGKNAISLISLKGNKEECISKGVKLNEDGGFYGHEKLEQSLDIYTMEN